MSVLLKERYRIIQDLGSGGFGKTYIAEDEQLFHRRCVIKQLAPEDPSPETFAIAKRLFDQEAKTLHCLGQHQQIPELYAHFEDQHQFYLVQALIDGQPMDQEIGIHPWVELEVILFLEDVLSTLSFVHQQGVIHRDIKPANLMRRTTDSKIVLIDFGAVKESLINTQIRTGSRTPTPLHTIAVGTPGYMPSEQAAGKPRFASDLYALGMTAIMALTGTRCEQVRENPTTGEIEWQHLVSLSPGLEAFLQKMVAYDFRQRFRDAQEALDALYGVIEPIGKVKSIAEPSKNQGPSVFLSPHETKPIPQTSLTPELSPLPQPPSPNPLPSATWQFLRQIKAHALPIKSMACHPQQNLLATASWDQQIKLWQLQTGQLLQTFKGEKSAINAVAFSPQGDQLASGGEDRKISLWQLNHSFPQAWLNGHSHWINCLAYSPDGSLLVSGSKDETVKLWHLNTGLEKQTINTRTQIWAVAFSPDNQFIAFGGGDRLIRLVEHGTGKTHKTLRGHDAAVKFIAFHPTQPQLLSGSEDCCLILWHINSGQITKQWRGGYGKLTAMAANPQGTLVATAGEDGVISLWHLPDGEQIDKLKHGQSMILSLIFSADGKILSSGDMSGLVKMWQQG